MDDDSSSHEGSDSIDWSTDDELDIVNISSSSSDSMDTTTNASVTTELGESSSSSYPSSVVGNFIKMGFPEAIVTKVISELGENDSDAILDTILTYSFVEETSREENRANDENINPQSNLESVFSDSDSDFSDEEIDEFLEQDDPVVNLIDMGYSLEEASAAVNRCGKHTPLPELIDFISAAHIAKEADAEMDKVHHTSDGQENDRKRKLEQEKSYGKRKNLDKTIERKRRNDYTDVLHLPNPMIGFGVPGQPFQVVHRTLPKAAIGPPYFLYENVAFTPKGVWSTIKSFLYEIEPEFVDSRYFCAAARKRGYIHNLPLQNRFMIRPLPPRTIFTALPETRKWWPSWDNREHLNCILTVVGTAQLTHRLKTAIEECGGEPSVHVKKCVLKECKKWNLVWTGKNKLTPLNPAEIEQIMGYPINHTRGECTSERYKGLGNAFQVDTVAYQLSVLKNLYPEGINVLSLFSGIGGAEVALHRLEIPMKNVVCVEKSAVCRGIIQSWWDQTDQKGNLVHVFDVQDVTYEKIDEWIRSFGGFDLVIGGSPCNNLAGGNRRTRDGLQGEHSSLFYEYVRILDAVKVLMRRN